MFIDKGIFDKYYQDYIDNVSIDNIEFKSFTYDELQDFLRLYYYDNDLNQAVFWINDGFVHPFGMYYLEFTIPYTDNYYVLGLVDNNIGGKTIVFCMEYDKSYQIPLEEEKKVGYITFIETNYYFRNRGVLKRSLDYIKNEFREYSVLAMTSMSGDGSKVGLFQRIVNLFKDTDVKVHKNDYVYSLKRKKIS